MEGIINTFQQPFFSVLLAGMEEVIHASSRDCKDRNREFVADSIDKCMLAYIFSKRALEIRMVASI